MRYTFLIILGLVVVAAVGIVPVAGAHSPQPQIQEPGGNQTAEPAETVIQVGSNVQVVDYRYADGTFHVTLRANITELVTVADVLGPVQNQGASTVPTKRIVLEPGKTTVSMDVGSYQGSAAVSIGTSEAGVYLSTGITTANPFGAVGPTAGWFGGAATVIGMGALALRKVRGEDISEPKPMGDD